MSLMRVARRWRRPMTGALIAAVAAAAALAGASSLGGAGQAQAYGRLAQYQITISENCNNPSSCGPNLGGFWGWAEFDTDGTADAQLTGCGHMQGGGPAAGAQHFSADAQNWFIAASSSDPTVMDFWVANETDRFTGRSGGPPTSIFVPAPMDTGIPATPGHYSTMDVLGFSAPPGVSIQIQVVKIPNR
jgi:hypothetical protein